MLGGELAVLQAPMFDGLSLDPFPSFDDGAGPAEVGVGRRHLAQALVVTLMVVALHEALAGCCQKSAARLKVIDLGAV